MWKFSLRTHVGLWVFVVWPISLTPVLPVLSPSCIFGPSCPLPCHCGVGETCDPLTGNCPSGCGPSHPFSDPWEGPGCQMGNVAYSKPTWSNTVVGRRSRFYNRPHLWYNSNNTVDGFLDNLLFGGSCSIIYTADNTTLPWIQVDLLRLHLVSEVSLTNVKNPLDASFLETFEVRLSNDTDEGSGLVCVRREEMVSPGGILKLACEGVGRYVTVRKFKIRGEQGKLPLCELSVRARPHLDVRWNRCKHRQAYWCQRCYLPWTAPHCVQVHRAYKWGMYPSYSQKFSSMHARVVV